MIHRLEMCTLYYVFSVLFTYVVNLRLVEITLKLESVYDIVPLSDMVHLGCFNGDYGFCDQPSSVRQLSLKLTALGP